MLVELKLNAVGGLSTDEDRSMVLLKERDGERLLPMMMSTRRALTLMMRSRLSVPMPVAATIPDAGVLLLGKFDIHLKYVAITMIKDGTFYCSIVAEREGEVKELEFCQAVDGLVYAMAAQCPIMIEEELLEAQYMHKTGENSFALNISTMTRKMLEEALQNAVEHENYEAASHLRDELAKRNTQE